LFRFKQFTLHDDRCSHKVGTDGTLLGAWADVSNVANALDIGTGSGLIALMLAQRSSADTIIDAIEVSPPEVEQASENVKNSPWPSKVNIHHSSLQNFFTFRKYDLIVSNPPYFINSYKPPDAKRITTRHTDSLSFQDLLTKAAELIHPSGRLCVVLPFTEAQQFTKQAADHSFHVSRQCSFRTRAGKPVERLLLEFVTFPCTTHHTELLLYAEGEEWSEDYKALTRGFYLKL
jgi:tRNA1Val (adenine37-N6)-methyltransferase